MALTRRQHEILEFLRRFLREKGYAPSLIEIGREFRLSSPATVHKHLAGLEARGRIRRSKNRKRWVEIVPDPEAAPTRELPLLGRVAAGSPIEAVEDRQTVSVPESMLGSRSGYVLRVEGDSMIEEQIRDGDYIVVEERSVAENGEVVVALIRGREATLKKFYRERGRVRLQPANPDVPPLILPGEEVAIQGVVVGLLRRYPRAAPLARPRD
jgi:repressor LexA